MILAALHGVAFAEAPDISTLPPHPRLYIGGIKTAAGYIDPATLPERAKARAADFALLTETSDIHARALAAAVSGDKAAIEKIAGELKGLSIRGGEDMARAGLAFDWIAASLADGERKEIAAHLGDLLPAIEPSLASRFNALDNNPLRRAMGIGLAALAIADDDPRAAEYFTQAQALMAEFLRETGDGAAQDDLDGRGPYGGGWPEGYDYNRHGSRYAMIYFLGLRSATGVDVFTGGRFWKDTQFFHIYEVLPNGYNVLPFQDNDWPHLMPHDRQVMLVLSREFHDPHTRWYLNHVNTAKESSSAVFEFLYDDPSLSEHDYSDLPKAHYIPGTGMVYARSGWGLDDTYVAFCASDWYVYHQNNAQNVFAVYRNAPLAIKDGVYTGGVHDHFVNYTIRTISYNGITVYDPNEKQSGPDGFPETANDGGQLIQQWHHNPDGLDMWREQARRAEPPMRDIVDWKGFETNDTYTYCAAEAGRAYMPGKVPFFSRQVLFVYPNSIIVFDRVTSGDPSFTKQFHIHAPEDLTVNGDEAVITTTSTNDTTIPGRLFVKSLLPAGAKVEKIEGIAVYGGQSHARSREACNGQVQCPVHLAVTAPEEKTTCFLTAMYACGADVEKAPDVKVVEETPETVTVSFDGGNHVATFNKTGEVGWKLVK